MQPILINFSGHTLSSAARDILSHDYSVIVDSKPVEIVFDDSVGAQIADLVASLPMKIDGSEPITIIPPGQATFAILLVSYLHGLIGHFPNICFLERSCNGQYLPKTEYDAQPYQIRSAGRRFRFEQF